MGYFGDSTTSQNAVAVYVPARVEYNASVNVLRLQLYNDAHPSRCYVVDLRGKKKPHQPIVATTNNEMNPLDSGKFKHKRVEFLQRRPRILSNALDHRFVVHVASHSWFPDRSGVERSFKVRHCQGKFRHSVDPACIKTQTSILGSSAQKKEKAGGKYLLPRHQSLKPFILSYIPHLRRFTDPCEKDRLNTFH